IHFAVYRTCTGSPWGSGVVIPVWWFVIASCAHPARWPGRRGDALRDTRTIQRWPRAGLDRAGPIRPRFVDRELLGFLADGQGHRRGTQSRGHPDDGVYSGFAVGEVPSWGNGGGKGNSAVLLTPEHIHHECGWGRGCATGAGRHRRGGAG